MKNNNLKPFKLLCLLVLLVITYPVHAQHSVSIADKTIAQAIKIIEGDTGYKFFYAENLPDFTKKVSFKTENNPLKPYSIVYSKIPKLHILLKVRNKSSCQKGVHNQTLNRSEKL